MDEATKRKLTSRTRQPYEGNGCWETPPLLYKAIAKDFGPFDIDLTADASRHLRPIWFGPGSPVDVTDCLTAGWWAYGRTGFSNPPYGRFVPQLLPYARTMAQDHGFSSTLLLPMRATLAFHAHILAGANELWYCDHRICFFENGVPRLNVQAWEKRRRAMADSAVFDSILVRYTGAASPLRIGSWHVPPHVTASDLARAVARRLSTQSTPAAVPDC